MYTHCLISSLDIGKYSSILLFAKFDVFWGEVGKENSILPFMLVPSILIMKYTSEALTIFVHLGFFFFCENPVEQISCAELLF